MEDSSDPCWTLVVVTSGVRMAITVIVTVLMIRCGAVLIVRVVECHGRDCSGNCW